MVRRFAFASITGLCLLAACGDDAGVDDANEGGQGGRGGGAAGKNTGGKLPVGEAGEGGVDADAGTGAGATAGMATGGTAGGPFTDGGVPGTDAGAGGTTPTAGTAGTPGTAGTTPIGSGGAGGEGGTPEPSEGGMGGAGGSGGTEEPPIPGLVARYTFDENAGTTAADQTGNFGAATLKAATFVPGRRGTSGVELSAEEAHVSFPPGFFSGVTKATIAVWVNQALAQPWSRIFDFNSAAGFIFLASDREGAAGPRLSIYNGNGATEGILLAPDELPLDVWKHLAVTVDGTTYSLFVDGYRAATAQTNARTPADIAPTVAGWLGKSTISGDKYFKGKFDDFQIHDVVLTQAQIAALAWPDSDYSYFRFEEPSGNVAADSSDREFHGTRTGGTFVAEGRVGGALHLTGANKEFVSVDPTLFTNCDDLTIALWAKPDTLANWTRLIDVKGDMDNFAFFTPARDDAGTQKLHFTIFTGADSAVTGTYPVGTVLTGQWHHYAVTLQGTVARLYFDGVEIGSNPNMTLAPSDIPLGDESGAWVGKSMFNNDPTLDGTVDELRVACRAYTAAEIRQLSR